MGIFSGQRMKSAGKATGGGLYFAPNDRYIVEIQKCSELNTKVKGDTYFLVEAKILHSENGKMEREVIPAWMVPIPGAFDMGLKNINSFIEAVTGLDVTAASVTPDMAAEAGEYLISSEQPLAGTIMVVRATEIQKKDKSPFTKIEWQQPTDEDYKKIGREKPKAA